MLRRGLLISSCRAHALPTVDQYNIPPHLRKYLDGQNLNLPSVKSGYRLIFKLAKSDDVFMTDYNRKLFIRVFKARFREMVAVTDPNDPVAMHNNLGAFASVIQMLMLRRDVLPVIRIDPPKEEIHRSNPLVLAQDDVLKAVASGGQVGVVTGPDGEHIDGKRLARV